jgi:acetyltransferase
LKSGNRFSAAIERAMVSSQKPVACFSSIVGGPVDAEILLPLREAGVPLMEGAECATATIRNLSEYYEFQRKRRVAHPAEQSAPLARLASGILPAQTAFRLFAEFGIAAIPTRLTRSADEAAAAADQIGFPVALKIESGEITHKSDVGGVMLNLSNGAEVRDAYDQILAAVGRRAPGVTMGGVLVQRMAPEGVEMIVGVKHDPMFGPVILCGLGGILVEVLKDVAIGIPPLSREQARIMLNRLRGFSILTGVRGKPAADLDALCDAIVGLSRLTSSLGDQLVGLDINPLIVLPKGHGVVAVDGLVHIA